MSSNGARHPEGPVGWIMRDEGQLDLYAGKSKFLMSVKGDTLLMASSSSILAEKINLFSNGISNFRILGKFFAKELFDGQKVLAVKPNVNISQYGVFGPETQVISPAGPCQIVNLVPLNQILDERMIFDTDPDESLLMPAHVEICKIIRQEIGVIK
jgi:hypothetical protein